MKQKAPGSRPGLKGDFLNDRKHSPKRSAPSTPASLHRHVPSLPRDACRPAYRHLLEPSRRLCQYIAHILARIRETRLATHEELSQLKQAARLLRELVSFAVLPGPMLSRENLEAGLKRLGQLVSPQEVQQAYYAAGDFGKGRPVVRRYIAAAALEAKRADPRLTRSELARKFCPCGKARHDQKCRERLRRDLQRLSALIRQILDNYPA